MRLSTEKLKEDLGQVLDEVLETGIPVEIERKGHILKIVAGPTGNKLDNLEPHDVIVGDPESIVYIDWSKEWNGEVVL
ncbi:MAG: type II toxin-antitoxin system Phd/YefM family antitoxin [Candidatus Aminicenantes bacterium]|nr:type II toxin-antitoxin system Phd/YefM family antitoxin [Candidatus Aminicenantes bacterium]